jgi:hypothetical protein
MEPDSATVKSVEPEHTFPKTIYQITSVSMGVKEYHQFLGKDGDGNGVYSRKNGGGHIKFSPNSDGKLEEVPV